MPQPNRRRSGGPRSPEGKATTRANAFKTGAFAMSWFSAQEGSEFNQLLAELQAAYAQPDVLMREDLHHLALALVRLRAVERRDHALHHQARMLAEEFAAQRPENSVAALLPQTPEGRALALAIMGSAAMPDPERIASIERSRILLERRIDTLMERVERRARAGGGRRPVHGGEPDISDAAVVARTPEE